MTMNTDPTALQTAGLISLNARTSYRGELLFPCVPAALAAYLQQLQHLFRMMGRPLTPGEQTQMQHLLSQSLSQGFAANPNAMLLLTYEVTGTGRLQKEFQCSAAIAQPSLTEQYQQWQTQDQAPLFGSHADAKPLDLLATVANPETAPVLDVGAGAGRNALAIARLGYPVHALELIPEFIQQLQTAAAAEQLPITVTQADLLDLQTQLPPQHYQFVLLSEVVPHFRSTEQLRQMLVKVSAALRPGGFLLFNCFLATAGYIPDALTKQIAEVAWSTIFTRAQLAEALAELPLKLLSDESVVDYESAHLPATAYPPTPWFEAWAMGKNALPLSQGQPPLELRWLLYRLDGS
jgi:SAM-dependent methyltransferase